MYRAQEDTGECLFCERQTMVRRQRGLLWWQPWRCVHCGRRTDPDAEPLTTGQSWVLYLVVIGIVLVMFLASIH